MTAAVWTCEMRRGQMDGGRVEPRRFSGSRDGGRTEPGSFGGGRAGGRRRLREKFEDLRGGRRSQKTLFLDLRDGRNRESRSSGRPLRRPSSLIVGLGKAATADVIADRQNAAVVRGGQTAVPGHARNPSQSPFSKERPDPLRVGFVAGADGDVAPARPGATIGSIPVGTVASVRGLRFQQGPSELGEFLDPLGRGAEDLGQAGRLGG